MQTLIKIREAKALPGNRLALVCSDGASGALAWPSGFGLSPWGVRRRMHEAGELGAAAED